MSNSLNTDILKKLSPLDGLKPEHLQELSNKAQVAKVAAGKLIHKRGDTDNRHFYLLKGAAELIDENNQPVQRISANSEASNHPLGHSQPRSHTCRVIEEAIVLSIDSNLIDIMLTWHQTGTYHVEEVNKSEDGQEDWMSQILQCQAFHKIPPTNIQALFMCMETVDYAPGEKIISQGEEGDYFYVIKSGKALVTRSTASNPKGVKLADLKAGDSFGEEALISDTKRNATITMLTRGEAVRLSKENFLSLLKEPILDWVPYEDGQKMVDEGAVWLDVRMPPEFKISHIPNSSNIPLIFLRMKYSNLDVNKKYILVCDTGRRSSSAAYILAEKGFNCSLLQDGLNGMASSSKESDTIKE